jgi:hypothetical protein
MSCCGQQRLRLSEKDSNRAPAGSAPTAHWEQRTSPVSLVYFEYIGKTALTVTGPITGKKYRFPQPGSKTAVDAADALSVATIPVLRQTRSS